jgi:hypothetical protein
MFLGMTDWEQNISAHCRNILANQYISHTNVVYFGVFSHLISESRSCRACPQVTRNWFLCAHMLATKGSYAGCMQVHTGLATSFNSRKCISCVSQVYHRCISGASQVHHNSLAALSQVVLRTMHSSCCYNLFCYILFCLLRHIAITTRASPLPLYYFSFLY